jgi:signal transduction histidine kinase
LLGTAPDWAEKFFPEIAGAWKGIDLIEIFPYLSVFLPEAHTYWESARETLLGSDMWIESPVAGTELHLRAFAVSKNDNHFLLVRLIEEDDIPVSQRTVQKAREHQLLYEKLQKAEKELKQLLYYKDKFVSIVSHDLRSPMASVVSIAEMLLTDDELMASMSDFNREMLVSMKEELERLLEYNNRLYHWSNLELGNFKLDKETISVKKLIHTALQTAKNKMEAKNIRYKAVVPEDFELEVDVPLFSQVLNNLLGNAVKFTPEGGEIKAGVKRENGIIRFFVSDTGVGMPEAVQKSIFAGVPNESTLGTSGEKGSGLGLDIVRKIVEAHGFSIAVASEVGKGSTFTITVPNKNGY